MSQDPVASALNEVGIQPAFQVFPEGTDTAEQAAAAIGCELGAIVKSLLFMAGEDLILVMVSGIDRVDEEKLAEAVERPVRKATANEIEERAGFKIGTVPPVGHATPMEVFLDRDLMLYRVLWAASGIRHRVFPISPVMLAAASGAVIVQIRVEGPATVSSNAKTS